jgi:isopenicillin N synthase-like dioxygenase
MTSVASLPIIDLSRVRSGDAQGLKEAAAQIHHACTTVGFFYVINHGVAESVIHTAVSAAVAFFDSPIELKRKVAVNRRHRGFNELGDATMYQAKTPDYKEFFTIGLELPEDDPSVLAGEPLRGPNNWPAFMPTLRPAFYSYYQAVGACGADLLRAVAVSLGIADDFFAQRYKKPLQRSQIIYYPPQPDSLGPDQFGVAPHTDYGCITLLWQDNNGGLQVRSRDSRSWIDALPIDGTFVVNVGDLLARWTNDRFASTPHRVINRSGKARYSIATFYDPDFTVQVDPRDLGTSAAECRYEPALAGKHILGRFDRSFGYRRKFKSA